MPLFKRADSKPEVMAEKKTLLSEALKQCHVVPMQCQVPAYLKPIFAPLAPLGRLRLQFSYECFETELCCGLSVSAGRLHRHPSYTPKATWKKNVRMALGSCCSTAVEYTPCNKEVQGFECRKMHAGLLTILIFLSSAY